MIILPRLGLEHLRQALTDDTCSNCACMPLAERTARLAKFGNGFAEAALLASGIPACSPPLGLKHSEKAPDAKKRRKLCGTFGSEG